MYGHSDRARSGRETKTESGTRIGTATRAGTKTECRTRAPEEGQEKLKDGNMGGDRDRNKDKDRNIKMDGE